MLLVRVIFISKPSFFFEKSSLVICTITIITVLWRLLLLFRFKSVPRSCNATNYATKQNIYRLWYSKVSFLFVYDIQILTNQIKQSRHEYLVCKIEPARIQYVQNLYKFTYGWREGTFIVLNSKSCEQCHFLSTTPVCNNGIKQMSRSTVQTPSLSLVMQQ